MRLRRHLSTKLALLVTLAMLSVLLALGVYFDFFLRANFLSITGKQMQHAYQRLDYNLHQIEEGVKQGAMLAKADERLLASVELISRYQDKSNYNTFLIDEEKKVLAMALLDRVKLSRNHEMAIYGNDGELIAFASLGEQGYQLGYLSFEGGKPQLFKRMEGYAEFQPGKLPALSAVNMQHVALYPNERTDPAIILTYMRLGGKLSIASNLSVFESRSGRPLAHLEMAHNLDPAYFAQLSREMGITIAYGFSHGGTPAAVPWEHREDPTALKIADSGEHYVSVLEKEVFGGPVYFSVTVDMAVQNAVLNTHRWRFLLLMALIAVLISLLMSRVIRQYLSLPLDKLMGQIQRVEAGDYTTAVAVASGDELERISLSVNQLAHAVQERESSLERSRNEQEYLSNHDALTGLPNRRFFASRLEHALDLARRNHTELAVLFMDVDQFKLVNDTLGHDIGDELLAQIGARLQQCLRSSDTLARIGGDEFNVLLENVGEMAEVESVLTKCIAQFHEPFTCASHEINATVSIGIAIYPKDGADSISMLKHADLAVYKAKESGRDRYSFFSQDLAERANNRAEMIHALKSALELGDQFTLYYQPKMNAVSRRIVSAEALIRWNRPGFGQVPPQQFIPLSEETGQILAIGEWVIAQGCRDLLAMQAAGVQLKHLSLNVSNVQLRSNALIAYLSQTIERNGLRPEQIELEITESYIAKDIGQAIATLNALRAQGLLLAIDDFGTGYSSMSYLHRLPFTRIKIDKSFIDGLPTDRDSISITRAILGLAKNFGLEVTAEGVEHEDQLQFLECEGCDEIQGYLFAKPMSLEAFIEFAGKH